MAGFGALVVNTASLQAIHEAGGDPTAAVLVVAPVVEEALKGSAVLLVLLVRRREFDGVVDGLVYAGLAGAGFAFVENVLYLGRGFSSGGGGALATVFVVRCVVSPFAHPLFTAATGVGLGLAVRSRRLSVTILAPVAGFAVAVALHAAWNLSALSGLSGFLGLFVAVQVPIFAGCVALAVLARRREGRIIARHLGVYVRTGWLTRVGGRDAGLAAGAAGCAGVGAADRRTAGARRDARLPGAGQRSWRSCGSGWCAGRRPADAQTHELAAARRAVRAPGGVPAGLGREPAATVARWSCVSVRSCTCDRSRDRGGSCASPVEQGGPAIGGRDDVCRRS